MKRVTWLSAALLVGSLTAACPEEEGLETPTPTPPPATDVADASTPLAPPQEDAAIVDDDKGAHANGGVTYMEHVRPILTRACVACHKQGAIAPFALDGYAKAKPFAPMIAKVTRARTMPPSVIDNGGDCNTFRDLPWLTDAEIETLEKWAENGAPEGTVNVPEPVAPELPKLTGDVKTIATPKYTPSTKQKDDYRCFVIKSPFQQQAVITGFDTHPGDSKTAHHMVVFYPMDDFSGMLAEILDAAEDGPGYNCFGSPGVPATVIAAWAPGGGATNYPDNLGITVAANRPLIVQMHYNTYGVTNPGEDMTTIDLETGKAGVSEAALVPMLDLEMNLAPGQKEVEEVVKGSLGNKVAALKGKPVEVYGVFPHMHETGKTLKVTAVKDGKEQCLIDAPRYSFHWQRLYFFEKPITIDSAAELNIRCIFDTTSRTEVTKWGEGTQDEMCVAGVFVKL